MRCRGYAFFFFFQIVGIFHGRFALSYHWHKMFHFSSLERRDGAGEIDILGALTPTQRLLQLTFRLLVHLVESPFEVAVSEYALTFYTTNMWQNILVTNIRIKYSWQFHFANGLSRFVRFQFSHLLFWNDANETMSVVQEKKNNHTYELLSKKIIIFSYEPSLILLKFDSRPTFTFP